MISFELNTVDDVARVVYDASAVSVADLVRALDAVGYPPGAVVNVR